MQPFYQGLYGCKALSYQLNDKPYPLQGYLAHKKHPPSLGPPYCPRHSPTVGSYEGVVSCERGTPVKRVRQGREQWTELLHVSRPVGFENSPQRYDSSNHTICPSYSVLVTIPLGTRGSRVEGPHTRGTSLGGVEDAQGTPTQSHISPSILVYGDKR